MVFLVVSCMVQPMHVRLSPIDDLAQDGLAHSEGPLHKNARVPCWMF